MNIKERLADNGKGTRIPKVIHYIWVGGNPLTPLAEKCIKSWEKNCPDYEIKRWDETNFDINQNEYCKQAYEKRKWAFVSDYIRLKVLYDEGGIYMDTDVEVLKPLDDFLDNHAFSGYENKDTIPTGIIASEKHGVWVKNLLKDYEKKQFINSDGSLNTETNVVQITKTTKKMYPDLVLNNTITDLKEVVFYPKDYFCPIDLVSNKKRITNNTYTIHWFAGSWLTSRQRCKKHIKKILNFISFGLFGKIVKKKTV